MPRDNGFEEWGGYMEAKITKLEEQFSRASDPFKQSNLFAGISIFVNGHTNPSADELKRLMMIHGGIYHIYERSHTTYIIASNLPDVKVRNMNTSKIISAQWVVDCLKEMKILDYTRYLLYTNQKTSQPSITFIKKKKEEPNFEKEENEIETINELNSIRTGLEELNARMKESAAANKSNVGNIRRTSTDGSGGGSIRTSNLARTAVDPKFLSEFYNNSRLHHISTLGAGFKQYVSELREQRLAAGQNTYPARQVLKEKLLAIGNVSEVSMSPKLKSCTMHIDMDCFFVSVGLRKHPHLRGQPVAVTHSKGGSSATEVPVHPNADRQTEMQLHAKRFEEKHHNEMLSAKVRGGFENKMSLSEIASASYEARAKGIRNGMFVGQALKLCPDLKTMPYDFEGYREVAFTLYNIIAQYTLNIEAVSCDEMFVDLTDILDELKINPMDFVGALRNEVKEKTGCPCSAGVGANKLQARMATKKAKPDGQYHLQSENVETYMAEIPIRDLPGVGSSTSYTLQDAQLLTCGDLQQVSLVRIQMLVGKKFGETLYQFCRGLDQRGLTYEQVRKSVSAEVNYGIRFKDNSELETFLKQLCDEVRNRLNDIKRKTKCVTLKLMVRAKDAPLEASKFMGHGVCDNVTKSVSLSEYTNDLETITRCVLATMRSLKLPPNELRGIGIQLTKLDDPSEMSEKPKENQIMNMFSKVKEKQKLEPQVRNSEVTVAEQKINLTKRTNDNTTKTSPEIKKPKTNQKGRSKAAGSLKINENPKTNVMAMLKNAAALTKQKEADSRQTARSIPADIDLEVFNALPLNIREEILREHELNQKNSTIETKTQSTNVNTSHLNESDFMPSTSKAGNDKLKKKQQLRQQANVNTTATNNSAVDPEFLAALPPDIRSEIEQQMKHQQQRYEPDQSYRPLTPPTTSTSNQSLSTEQNDISTNNIFLQNNCIELLLAWIQSCATPETCDIDLMCSHARELVKAKELDKLYDALLYLGRLLNQQKPLAPQDCPWHLAFRLVLDAVQNEMLQVFEGKKLYLAVKLKCDKCKI